MGKRRPSGDGMVRGREDGRWEGRIVVGHKANGDSIFRYFSAGSQRELMRKLHREQEVYQGVDLTEECRITLAEWLDRWMETYMEGAVRASTLRGMRHDVERHIKPRLGETIISEISQADVQSLYAALLENGRVHPHPELGTGLSASTIRKIHGILHGALKAAKQARLIPHDPTEGVTLPPVERPPQQILTRRETDRFSPHCQSGRRLVSALLHRPVYRAAEGRALRPPVGRLRSGGGDAAGAPHAAAGAGRHPDYRGDQDLCWDPEAPSAGEYSGAAATATGAGGLPLDVPQSPPTGGPHLPEPCILSAAATAEKGGAAPNPVPRSAAHLRHPRLVGRRRCHDSVRHPGPHQRLLHAGHLHPRHR